MSKFGGFLARKPVAGNVTQLQKPADITDFDNPLDLDEELFSALGAQLGGENETLRNLLLDANNKIGELDTIKAAVGKLVDPVSKALARFREREEREAQSPDRPQQYPHRLRQAAQRGRRILRTRPASSRRNAWRFARN